MCQELNTEIELSAWRIRNEHGADVATVACLVQVTECLFTHHAEQHNVSLDALLSAQRECIDSWLVGKGLTWSDVDAARRDINRAVLAARRAPPSSAIGLVR